MDHDEDEERGRALRDLVELRRPLSEATDALTAFEWDSEEELVTLTRVDAIRLIDLYTSGRLQPRDCAVWAEALETRDDLALEAGFEDMLKDFLFEVATPELGEAMSSELAARWRGRLDPAGEAEA